MGETENSNGKNEIPYPWTRIFLNPSSHCTNVNVTKRD